MTHPQQRSGTAAKAAGGRWTTRSGIRPIDPALLQAQLTHGLLIGETNNPVQSWQERVQLGPSSYAQLAVNTAEVGLDGCDA